MNKILIIFIATIFFIIGQIFYRKSFEVNNTFIYTFLVSTLFFGIFSLILIIYDNKLLINTKQNKIYPILGSLMFFIGTYFWFKVISMKISLGIIRIYMAAFETILLFILSYLFFNDKITKLQFIGAIIILIGIYITSIES